MFQSNLLQTLLKSLYSLWRTPRPPRWFDTGSGFISEVTFYCWLAVWLGNGAPDWLTLSPPHSSLEQMTSLPNPFRQNPKRCSWCKWKKTIVLKSKGVCWLCMSYWCVSSWTGVWWGRLRFANEFFTSWVNKQHHTVGHLGFDWKCSTLWLDRWSTEVDMSFLVVDSEKHFKYFFYLCVLLGLISENE